MMLQKLPGTFFLLALAASTALAQTTKMDFEKYNPTSTLVVPQHPVQKSKFPFIDVHNHQWSVPSQDITVLIKEMDALNMQLMINLSGKAYKSTPGKTNGDFDVQDNAYLVKSMAAVKKVDARRVMFFTNISFVDFGSKDWATNTVAELEKDVKAGACGLKLYKDFGMEFKDEKDKIIAVDDPRLDPIWEKCGQLHIPVIIHTADPNLFGTTWMNTTNAGWSWPLTPAANAAIPTLRHSRR